MTHDLIKRYAPTLGYYELRRNQDKPTSYSVGWLSRRSESLIQKLILYPTYLICNELNISKPNPNQVPTQEEPFRMRITSVTLNPDTTDAVGLSEVIMKKLGETVVLAGKNGSGKTRLLKLIKDIAKTEFDIKKKKLTAPQEIIENENAILVWEKELDDLKLKVPDSTGRINQLINQIDNSKSVLEMLKTITKKPVNIIWDDESKSLTIIDFVPNSIDLEDWSTQTKDEWMRRANSADSIGVSNLRTATIPLVHMIKERWVNATHQNLQYDGVERDKVVSDHDRLCEIIKYFLGTEVGWNIDSYTTVFDKPISKADLSAGQKIILQLCAAIFAQGGSISESIIFMDEPENHLHPSAVIELIDRIKQQIPNGQIWIATHSIPLLSHFDASSLWFVENGQVCHAGKKPEMVLNGLLGGEERIEKLKDFTGLPDELARNRFAFECLCPPGVVETDANDPQVRQLYEQLKIIWLRRKSINLLDYGAGRGRLISNLADYDKITSTAFNYYAFDISDENKSHCLKNISTVYKDSEKRYFNSLETIRLTLGHSFFDIVTLCNVMHEIKPIFWCDVFNGINEIINDDGYLLIIEDCKMTIGELPHENGYIVFNTGHLRRLFDIPISEEKFIANDARFDSKDQMGRLMAHLIPKKYISNISTRSIRDSVIELQETSIAEIEKVRKLKRTYHNGIAHAFWTHQVSNTYLCLRELK
jgi:ABC-type multidrug transport system ATPase subunit